MPFYTRPAPAGPGGPQRPTNLSLSLDADSVGIGSSTGQDVDIPTANATNAGVLSAALFTKLDNIDPTQRLVVRMSSVGSQEALDGVVTTNIVSFALVTGAFGAFVIGDILVYDTASSAWVRVSNITDARAAGTDLGRERDGVSVTVTSSSGDNAVLPPATDTDAGVMLAVDKAKLDGIEAGATGDQTSAEIVAALSNLPFAQRLSATQLRDLATLAVVGIGDQTRLNAIPTTGRVTLVVVTTDFGSYERGDLLVFDSDTDTWVTTVNLASLVTALPPTATTAEMRAGTEPGTRIVSPALVAEAIDALTSVSWDDVLAKPTFAPANAEQNVQADWNETDTASDAYIANKPSVPAAQVPSDWNATTGVARILNKPTIPVQRTFAAIATGLNALVGAARVSYNSLKDLPTTWAWSAITGIPAFATRWATYAEIGGTKPPANAEANVQSDWNATSGDAFIRNKPAVLSLPATATTSEAQAGSETGLRSFSPALLRTAIRALAPTQPQSGLNQSQVDGRIANRVRAFALVATTDLLSRTGLATLLNAATTDAEKIDYTKLKNLPSLAWATITGKPTNFPTTWAMVSGKPTLAPANAEQNVQSDWAATSGDAQILNKPGDATTSASGFMSSTDKTKLDGVAAGAEVNVNADWNATSGDAQVLNKPPVMTQTEAEEGTVTAVRQVTPQRLKQAIDEQVEADLTQATADGRYIRVARGTLELNLGSGAFTPNANARMPDRAILTTEWDANDLLRISGTRTGTSATNPYIISLPAGSSGAADRVATSIVVANRSGMFVRFFTSRQIGIGTGRNYVGDRVVTLAPGEAGVLYIERLAAVGYLPFDRTVVERMEALDWDMRLHESALRPDYAGGVTYQNTAGLLLPVSRGTAPATGLVTLDTNRRACTHIEAVFTGPNNWTATYRFDALLEWDRTSWTNLGSGPDAGTTLYALAIDDDDQVRFFVRDFNTVALDPAPMVRLTELRMVRDFARLSRVEGVPAGETGVTAATAPRSYGLSEFLVASEFRFTDGTPPRAATQPLAVGLPDQAKGQTKLISNYTTNVPLRVMTTLRAFGLVSDAARNAYTGDDSVLVPAGESRLVIVAADEDNPGAQRGRIMVAGSGKNEETLTAAAYTALTVKDPNTYYNTY